LGLFVWGLYGGQLIKILSFRIITNPTFAARKKVPANLLLCPTFIQNLKCATQPQPNSSTEAKYKSK
jgi:hypothetical protein